MCEHQIQTQSPLHAVCRASIIAQAMLCHGMSNATVTLTYTHIHKAWTAATLNTLSINTPLVVCVRENQRTTNLDDTGCLLILYQHLNILNMLT